MKRKKNGTCNFTNKSVLIYVFYRQKKKIEDLILILEEDHLFFNMILQMIILLQINILGAYVRFIVFTIENNLSSKQC